MEYTIRPYKPQDRPAIRKICCATAFMGKPASLFFNGNELLADILTLYYTDYEPNSCFVAVIDNQTVDKLPPTATPSTISNKQKGAVSYLTGTTNIPLMNKTFKYKILPRLILKTTYKGILFRKKNIIFIKNCIKSLFCGELFTPSFTKEYPATLHINTDSNYRRLHLGNALLEKYLSYLQQLHISGVQCHTMSEKAKDFFLKYGFTVLHKTKKSYWDNYATAPLSSYTLGKKLQ